MATPKDSVMKASDSYQKFSVLDEEIEVYLKITKLDTETGKPVLLPNTAFQIYWLDDNGNYRLENGNTVSSTCRTCTAVQYTRWMYMNPTNWPPFARRLTADCIHFYLPVLQAMQRSATSSNVSRMS